MYEDFGSKFKLYSRANTVVAIPEQLYGYRQRNNGTIGKTNQPKTFLEELKVSNDMLTNVEKYIYYMDIMNFSEKKIYKESIDYITVYSLYNRVNMLRSEEDKQLYFKYIDRYKEKLKRYWNM